MKFIDQFIDGTHLDATLAFRRFDNPENLHFNAIAATQNHLFIAGEFGTIWRSDDDGENWQLIQTNYEGSFFSIVSGNNNDELLLLGLRGTAFLSGDAGETWKKLDTETRSTLTAGIRLASGKTIIVGYDGLVLSGKGENLNSYYRRDMMPNMAVAQTNNKNLVVVGMGGVRLTAPTGSDVEIADND